MGIIVLLALVLSKIVTIIRRRETNALDVLCIIYYVERLKVLCSVHVINNE